MMINDRVQTILKAKLLNKNTLERNTSSSYTNNKVMYETFKSTGYSHICIYTVCRSKF